MSELPYPFTDYTTQEKRPCTLTGQYRGAGSGVVVSWTEGLTAGKLTLLSADFRIGWPNLSCAGEFAPVAQIRESLWADPLCYHPGPNPGL